VNTPRLKYTLRIKSAKTFFFFALILFVAKPFFGFCMFSQQHPPAQDNIFVKVFSKRKLEYEEDSNFSLSAIQQKLAEPLEHFFLLFSSFLSVLFLAAFAIETGINGRYRRLMQLSLSRRQPAYLLNSNLTI
jgi:hypothetical protein